MSAMKKLLAVILMVSLFLCPLSCLAIEPGSETETETETEPVHKHNLVKTEAKAATCKEEGHIAYWQCTDTECKKYYSDESGANEITWNDIVIGKTTDHKFVWETTVIATKTEPGKMVEKCSVCGILSGNEKEIAPYGHVHSMQHTDGKQATCTQEGNIEYWYCSGCKTYYKDAEGKTPTVKEQTVLKKTDHNYTWVIDKEATATANGSKHEECANCGAKRSENTVIPAVGGATTEPASQHPTETPSTEITDADHVHKLKKIAAKEATCLKEGNIEYWYCSECARYYQDSEGKLEIKLKDITVKKSEHCFVWVEDQPATEEKTGLKHEECSVCGEKLAENTVIPLLGHTHSLIRVEARESNCLEQGNKEYYICPDCALIFLDKDAAQETTIEDVKLPLSGHTPITTEDGRNICLICGAEIVDVEEPRLLEGANQVWNQTDGEGLSFATNILPVFFRKVLVDGEVLDEALYTLEGENEITLVLKPELLHRLTKGQHTVNIEAENGEVATLFTVNYGEKGTSHKWIIWVTVLLLIPIPEIPNIIRLIKKKKIVK